MNVLVADDDEDIRFVVTALLSSRGWTVTAVSSGVEAIGVLATSQFDALVLDQNMPPGSGLEVVDHLRSTGDRTPVILFTGFSATIDRARTDESGVVVMEKTDVSALSDRLAVLTGRD